MRFPYQATLGSVLRDFAGVQRRGSYARVLGLSSITKGEGSLDLLSSDGSSSPSASYGDLPGGDFGVGAVIDGSMVNLASYARAEKVRNDTQDTTLASHNTRITTAQSTANGAVTVNSTQNSRLNSLESALSGAASQSQMNTLINEIGSLKLRVIAIENVIRSLHPGVLP